MREVIARSQLQSILTKGRSSIEIETQEIMQGLLDEYESGIQITQVQTQKADPPDEVIDAFRDVQAARADMERAKNEAEGYQNDVIPRARGDAAKILQEAEAYQKKVIAMAEGEASRFLAIYTEYAQAKRVTQERMYLETMEKVLADIDKGYYRQKCWRSGSLLAFTGINDEIERNRYTMKLGKFIIPLIFVIGLSVYLSLFTVKEINQAIVLQFGDPKKIITTAGLQFKIPFIQNVVFLDRRILSLDPPPAEVIASDQKRLIVDAYARFKIIDPVKFYISVGDERVARSRLATIINSRIRSVLGKQSLATLLSEERSTQMSIIQEGVNVEAEKFGITIIDVRIKRADLPQANSEAIIQKNANRKRKRSKRI